jgi:hypothetical protein
MLARRRRARRIGYKGVVLQTGYKRASYNCAAAYFLEALRLVVGKGVCSRTK